MKKIDLHLRSIYFLLGTLFVLLFFTINPNFREDDWSAIRKVIYPHYYINPNFFHIDLTQFNPYYNHHYLSAFLIKLMGCEENFAPAGRLLWFVEHGIIAILFLLLANYFFRGDNLVLALTFLWVIFYSPSPWVEPKFAATIFMILSMLFYFKRKFFAAAFFAAVVFYFHIGFATWWLLVFLFVLAWLWLKEREITFLQCVQYGLTIGLFAFPIIWTYFQMIMDARVDDFTNSYAFYSLGYQVSPLLAFQYAPTFIISRVLSIILVLLSVRRAEEADLKFGRIRPVAWGVIALMVSQFILGDLMKIMAISKIQLVRAPVVTDILWPILVSFLIAAQIRRKNYFFGVFLLIILWGYNLAPQILGWDMYGAFNIFCALLIISELFEKPLNAFLSRASLAVPQDFKKIIMRLGSVLFQPIVLLALSVMVLTAKLPFFKPMIKTAFNLPVNADKLEQQEKRAGYLDIFEYMNKNLPYNESAFLFPFTHSYVFNHTHHNLFNINSDTPVHGLFYNNEPSLQFKEVFENDLKCTVRRTFLEKDPACSWDVLWRNLDVNMIYGWKKKYGLTHVVRERELPLDLPVVYENEFYVLYVVR